MSDVTPVVEGLFDDDGLIGGSCGACARRHFPRAAHCPWCGVTGPETVRLSTNGRVWAWTAVQTAPPGYEGPVPFGFGVVELPDDELRVVTLLTEPDPAQLAEGDEVRFTVVPVGGGRTSWGFAPVPT
jgi:uncharacterized OB-fold protein